MSQPPQPPFSGDPQSGEPNPGQPYYAPPPQDPAQPQYPDQPQYPAQPENPQYPGQQQYPAPYQPPYAGQPNPDVPTSVPPGYQPQYGFPPPPVEPPQQKGRTLPIVLTSVAIFLVLCLGGSTAAVLVFRNQGDDKLTSADATPESTAPPATTKATDEPSPDPTTPRAAAVKIVQPKTLGGRPRMTDDVLKSYLDLLKTMMSSYPSATKSVSGMYGKAGSNDIVVMAAAQADIPFPEVTVDAVLSGGNAGTKVTGITSVSTGSLGGTAKCGTATASGEKMAICVWADDGSLGMVIFYFKSAGSIKSEFPKVRAEIEKKA